MSAKKKIKRGRGRPRIYGEDEVRVWVRCTPKERATWTAHAKRDGRDLSKLIRFLLERDVMRANDPR